MKKLDTRKGLIGLGVTITITSVYFLINHLLNNNLRNFFESSIWIHVLIIFNFVNGLVNLFYPATFRKVITEKLVEHTSTEVLNKSEKQKARKEYIRKKMH